MIIGISSRIDFIAERAEYRDSLDHRVHNIALHLGLGSMALPNIDSALQTIFRTVNLSGFILSGGNNLSRFENSFTAIRRDEIDRTILSYAIQNNLPVLGICRGAQFIANYFSCRILKRNHIGTHTVHAAGTPSHYETEVNSYHNYCIDKLAHGLRPIAVAADCSIEAFYHERLPLYAVMWHPERATALNIFDLQILKMYTACMKH